MLLRMLLRGSIVTVLAGALCAGAAGGRAWAQAESEGPSLAELAGKKKKGDKKTTLVYSDENLPKAGADFGGTSTAGASGAAAASGETSEALAAEAGTPSATSAGSEGEAGEASLDLAAAKEKAEIARQDEQSLKNNIKRLEDQLANETSEFRRETYQTALERARENQAELTRRREEAEKEEAAAEAAEGKKKKKKKPAATEETPQ